MAKYIVTKTFKSPLVYSGGAHPKMSSGVRFITFKRGRVIEGELVTKKDGSPDYILHKKAIVVPIAAVRELITREVVSNASGETVTASGEKKVIKESTSKVRYFDSAIIGGLIGLACAWVAEKKGWIVEVEGEGRIKHQNKLIAIAVGAAAGAYYTYRKNIKTGVKIVKDAKN